MNATVLINNFVSKQTNQQQNMIEMSKQIKTHVTAASGDEELSYFMEVLLAPFPKGIMVRRVKTDNKSQSPVRPVADLHLGAIKNGISISACLISAVCAFSCLCFQRWDMI